MNYCIILPKTYRKGRLYLDCVIRKWTGELNFEVSVKYV